MNRSRGRLARPVAVALAGLAAVLLLVLGELAARIFAPPPRGFFVWPPHLVQVFRPRPELLAGVVGPSRFAVNSLGLRGEEPSGAGELRILAVGGSATECLYLDQAEAWPALAGARLGEAAGRPVWVGNAGRSGHTTREHRLQVEELVRLQPRPDILLIMAGVNDLCRRLSQDSHYDPGFLRRPGARAELLPGAFSVVPDGPQSPLPRFKQTALWRVASKLRSRLFPDPRTQKETGEVYGDWRAKRGAASHLRTEPPDLGPALVEFQDNLTACVRACKLAGVRPILLDQPALWRGDLPPELERTLWMGGVGDYTRLERSEYYSAAALAQGLERYNEVVALVAREEAIERIELAARLPRDGTIFYDDVHFTEAGARAVAAIVADALIGLLGRDGQAAPR